MNKVQLSFLVANFLFLGSGACLLALALVSRSEMAGGLTSTNVARELLIMRSPLTATIVNAAFIFAAFLLSLPALALPTTRGWLKAHGWFVFISAVLTLIIGLDIWYHTLKTRANLNDMWDQQAADVKSLLQAEV
ncbi:MAG: hypothetical protein M1812_005148 [Candelaria pacifica]|nr:MAG: hypothetical protein M1812_005148 [Candelaria pacifica]